MYNIQNLCIFLSYQRNFKQKNQVIICESVKKILPPVTEVVEGTPHIWHLTPLNDLTVKQINIRGLGPKSANTWSRVCGERS